MTDEPFGGAIVGIDGRGGGEDALALAKQLVRSDGTVALAHVLFVDPTAPLVGSKAEYSGQQERALKRLRLPDGSSPDAQVLPVQARSVGEGLHALALNHDADLIAVGACARGPVGRLVIGDDTRSVLEQATCPVAVAPVGYARRAKALREIGVAYDGSPESGRALSLARKLAAERGAELSAFEVVPPPAYVSDPWNVEEAIDRDVEKARERIAAFGDVEPRARSGALIEQLTLYGDSLDLLVVGARGYSRLRRLLHPSTSQRLARTATCPLLVVPRE